MQPDNTSLFSELAKELAGGICNAILVDQVVYNFEMTEDIMMTLVSHISNNLIKIGKSYFRQKVGIPQGSILSVMLCR